MEAWGHFLLGKMASFDESKLFEALEKSMLIAEQGHTRNLLVKGCAIETTIFASSSFKAAVKMGYVLLDLNLINHVDSLCVWKFAMGKVPFIFTMFSLVMIAVGCLSNSTECI